MLISAPSPRVVREASAARMRLDLSRACEVHESSSGDGRGLAMAAAAVDGDQVDGRRVRLERLCFLWFPVLVVDGRVTQAKLVEIAERRRGDGDRNQLHDG